MFGESLILMGLGLVLGIEHAFEADHIVAVSTLVSRHKDLKKATIMGIFWGLGHTTTLFIAGMLVLGLKISIPEKIALSLELIVGIIIVLLGISLIRDIFQNKSHIHKHTHGLVEHTHLHPHKDSKSHDHSHRSFFVGLIHGMAGSAALMLLVLSTVKSIFLGMIFIMIFGVGSIIGMMFASTLISIPFIFTARKQASWNKRIQYITGVSSILFGSFLIVKIALFEGLLF